MKKTSIIFLLILIVILVFIIGVRRGQQVEKTNKIINYLISLPPSQTPQPTQKPLEFKTYKNNVCGIQFLYPIQFNKSSESSDSAHFSEKDEVALSFSCDKASELKNILEDETGATSEIKLKDKKLIAKSEPIGSKDIITFQIKNPFK